MLRISRPRNLSLTLAAIAVATVSLAVSADFRATDPGSNLTPVGAADQMVEILQGNQNVLWSSLAGPVLSYRVEGWPVSVGEDDLGGALVIERPVDGSAGVIDFGEKPKSLSFELDR
jgi:hypothetical protein